VLRPRFAYVANARAGTIAGYSVNPASGTLQSIGGSPFVTGSNPRSVTTDVHGRFAYVTHDVANQVAGFRIDIHPSGRFLFVVTNSDNSIKQYLITRLTGELTEPSASFADIVPAGVVVDPLGRFVFAATQRPSILTWVLQPPFTVIEDPNFPWPMPGPPDPATDDVLHGGA
jgi:6-phosphogluconolactonase (cycloisomerase 2 family)